MSSDQQRDTAGSNHDGTLLPIVRTVPDLRARVSRWRARKERVALVPTMGALHEGHLSLMREGQALCERVVATIFVNPKQFNRAEDLQSYPSDNERDIKLLTELGVDLLYMPEVREIYPPGFQTVVSLPALSSCLCGAHRPGHFDGVSTVVSKLLLQSLPDIAIFGEKDFQQLQIIRRMVRDLNIPVSIKGGATIREADGLALSSRNRLLNPEERARAVSLYRVLSSTVAAIEAGDLLSPALERAREELSEAHVTSVDYLEIREEQSLELFDAERSQGPARIFAAIWLGSTRIIDNLPVKLPATRD
ncbi:pantoate--beta-alanine ligase [Denitrobaculum tricleocarpae]|uniref:Pantothenate synthetase n=1 Tax=Denitrobaculum tricleocarpae TaxID=2591009 RepID=A0A545U1C6_9PROT|nr:pantoate--beta-alanine ligase [Denitrobaculum tricleocarpae]TQV83287.1 pantoate--beta-alanine ligase [Denitrobaculum tricleocarpae]